MSLTTQIENEHIMCSFFVFAILTVKIAPAPATGLFGAPGKTYNDTVSIHILYIEVHDVLEHLI